MDERLNISRVQRFSVDDGPGIRSTVFMKGCNLRCRWCHNPENLTAEPVLQFRESSCLRCRLCADICPSGAHVFTGRLHSLDRGKCIACGKCSAVCPNHSLEWIGRMAAVDEVVREVLKDRDYYEMSGGGVTFSGGEPLLQPKPLAAALQECKRRGLSTAVDTAGNVPFSAFEEIIPYTDLFLYDIKCISSALHKRHTAVSNERIMENAERLRERKVRMWIRTPLIPGFNEDEQELKKIREFVCQKLRPELHEELPYHNYGEGKYVMLGIRS